MKSKTLKNSLIIVLIMALTFALIVTCANAQDKVETIIFAWDQPELSYVQDFRLYWSDVSGGPYTEVAIIPLEGSELNFEEPVELTVTGEPGATVPKYFVLIACGTVPEGSINSGEYLCSDDSNEAAHDFTIPAGAYEFQVPVNFRIIPEQPQPPISDKSFEMPQIADWTDPEMILPTGALGEWDYRIEGSGLVGMVEFGGQFLLYYTGASGNRSDGGPAFRSIGLATSQDGANFTKHLSSPVVTYLPSAGTEYQNQDEEGIFSGAVTIHNGQVIIMYGGMAAQDSSMGVVANVRYAISDDGINFTDQPWGANEAMEPTGVLHYLDSSVWGYGDELSACGVYADNDDQFIVSYTADGHEANWALGQAWGPSFDDLSTGSNRQYPGPNKKKNCGYFYLSPDEIGMMVVRIREDEIPSQRYRMRFYRLPKGPLPQDYLTDTAPEVTWILPQFRRGTVYVSPERNKAYLVYRDEAAAGLFLRTADLREIQ